MKTVVAEIPRALSGPELLFELKRLRLLRPASEALQPVVLAPSGLPELDALCGGFPCGRITEVVVSRNAGATLVYDVLAAATGRGEAVALLDPGDGFDPLSASAAKVNFVHFLWVRSRNRREALRGAELILEAGGFGLVILDLRTLQERAAPLPRAAWMRLMRRAAGSKAVLLVVSGAGEAGTFAALAIRVQRGRARWQGRGVRWLERVDLSFGLLRKRGG